MCTDFLSNLSRDLSLLLNDTESYDTLINVGEKHDFKTFRSHSIILRVRSPYFKTALSSEWAKIENNLITFSKPNIRPIVFEVILKFIYTGKISLDDYDALTILDLLVAADELCLQELIDHAQDYLLCYKPSWMQRNFATTHKIAFQHSCAFTKLKDYYDSSLQNSLNNSPLTYFLNFSSSPSSLSLTSALANLSISSPIKDISCWTSKEFLILASTLEKFIPFIRFLQISSSDFYKKVKPFASILPFDLYDDILQYHLVPDYIPHDDLSQPERATIDSVIIKRKHAALIASWIDGRDLDGDSNNDNSGICSGCVGNNISQTCHFSTSITSTSNSSNVSQNSSNWSQNSSPIGFRNIISRVRDPARAINYYKNYGPSFGRDDLKMAGNFKLDSRCCCKQGDYEFPIRENTGYFSVDEYEVFSVHLRRPLGKDVKNESNSMSGFNDSNIDGENKLLRNNGITYYGGGGNMIRSLTY
ncbi:6275_t:CDS:2 [Cetraspora pellucida]|uniref:6275_t:CDS:1 n=1 Tax=Cetraspora pellucida TaxID=1433469 RepID=A0A9N9N2D8_9GLOM|nr:6275_t:CDS:2 [Cetraspora pellucida]